MRLRGVPFHVCFTLHSTSRISSIISRRRGRADGNYGFGFPLADARLAALAVDDTGGVVTAIFETGPSSSEKPWKLSATR